ncbi:MAG: homoserine dehydrogenase [Candidatus Nanopelagicaceae bacterium]|nr:homoserine dehydrogenase [Candidatus Nanopelagicaceae bacterium]
MNAAVTTLHVGMLGCGVVGSNVARLLQEDSGDFAARSGANLKLSKVAVKNINAKRDFVPNEILTTDANSVVSDPNIQIVIEVMGGIEPARELILTAIKNGKSIITANKALLALHGGELFDAADKNGVDLYYEAAVGGAIPILRPMRESIVGDHVHRVMGIVNGTTNYILTKMDEEGSAFSDVLKEAQSLGFAEADPTADIEGHDAAAKAAILAGLAFHTRVSSSDVHCEGISKLTARDVEVARDMNHVIKLLAIAELTADNRVSVRVHPTLVSRQHPLASVRNAFNAVFIEAESAGELMFYGRGAGGAPTASAVLGDLIAVARNKTRGVEGHGETDYADLAIAPIDDVNSRYLIRVEVADKPGVLATVAQLFASSNVSIETVRQTGRGDSAELIVATHSAPEKALNKTVAALSQSDVVKSVESVLRILGSGK